jgi:hypothetical protein
MFHRNPEERGTPFIGKTTIKINEELPTDPCATALCYTVRMSSPRKIVALAWYRPQDWARLLEISEDRDDLEPTHAEWVAGANKIIRAFEETGQPCERILINLDDLIAWCRARKCPIDGAARSEFAAEILTSNH